MTTDLDGIEQRLAKGVRPTKQEVEQLIALACSKVRLRTGSPKLVDEIEAEIRTRVNQILAAGRPSVARTQSAVAIVGIGRGNPTVRRLACVT
jgi:hypothetical protein